MFDIWGFLLQTLTVSGVAILLLIIKALFRDKLPPKWHFAVWSVLGIIILFPSGINGRYTLFNWRIVVESIKMMIGDYSTTRVSFPFPYINSIPDTVSDWLFVIYTVGIIICLVKYLISYIKIRNLLHKGKSPAVETISRVCEIANNHNIKPCRIVEISGLPSAFVCGVLSPVLVVPACTQLDDKVILHELLHLKYKDTLWSIIICLLRCLHWCNPLINYCANRAINDMESRCDQHVLELLEGEEIRDYGRILLSMSNERFAKTPGSTCINNGGKNIRQRIEAIARFKKYPVGMGLASVCVIIALTFSLVIGVQATSIPESQKSTFLSLASAKSTFCTTYAGAFDTYAKAVLRENRNYRMMCAPENMHADLIDEKSEIKWESGMGGNPDTSESYYIYNLKIIDKDVYEGLLVIKLVNVPDGMEQTEEKNYYLAFQKLRVEKENGRWVTIPLSEFKYAKTDEEWLHYGCRELPAVTYTGTASDFTVNIQFQTIYIVDNKIKNDNVFSILGNSYSYSSVPKLNAEFGEAYDNHESNLIHLGTQEERDLISQVGISAVSVYPGEEKPEELAPAAGSLNSGGNSSSGESWGTKTLEPGWGPDLFLTGGGGGGTFFQLLRIDKPEYYVADLYVNNELYAQMELRLQEE